ncbi:hypothetical protein IWZ03DRAFT_171347 [Phyllosticta citriasiana]|uniref:Uncharacterized protein n=1 Tax=Phyllosticta citriasiana TaxID=595635 RepID=A0ABR1KPX3_9PEZI
MMAPCSPLVAHSQQLCTCWLLPPSRTARRAVQRMDWSKFVTLWLAAFHDGVLFFSFFFFPSRVCCWLDQDCLPSLFTGALQVIVIFHTDSLSTYPWPPEDVTLACWLEQTPTSSWLWPLARAAWHMAMLCSGRDPASFGCSAARHRHALLSAGGIGNVREEMRAGNRVNPCFDVFIAGGFHGANQHCRCCISWC